MANTSAPLSEVSIANAAIDIIHDVPLAALDDDNKVGRFMARNFGLARDQILESWPWRIARARASLAADGTAPSFGWDYSYTLPTDCLKPLPLRYNGEWNGVPVPHELEGDKILCDQSGPLYFRYIKRETNVTKFTPLLARVISARLAVLASQNITGKSSYLEAAKLEFQDAWEAATLSESLANGTPEFQYRDDIIAIRELDPTSWNGNYPFAIS